MHSIEYLKSEAKNAGYTLLSNTYTGCKQKLRFVDCNGIEFTESWNSFQQKRIRNKKDIVEFKYSCPFCNKNIVGSLSHVYRCDKKPTDLTSKKEIRFLYIKFNFPEISNKDYLYKEYVLNLKSLPDFKKEYGISYKSLQFLLDYFFIKKRSHKEVMNLDKTKSKREDTCIVKFGKLNPLSKGAKPFLKRNNTVIEKYGVSNVFQIDEIKKHITSDELYLKRFGITRYEFLSIRARNVWKNKSEKEREEWLYKSIKSDEGIANLHSKGCVSSSLEDKIEKYLNITGLTDVYERHFRLKRYDVGRTGYVYDFLFHFPKVLLEINGDYWHANPRIYKSTDIFYGGKTAKDIWKKDFKKRIYAEKFGYKLIYLWEDEIKNNLWYDILKSIFLRMKGVIDES